MLLWFFLLLLYCIYTCLLTSTTSYLLSGTCNAHFSTLNYFYLEWCTVLWRLWGWYILIDYTFGLLFLCWEVSIDDFAGTFNWIDLLILLMRLLTAEIVGLLVYYLAEVLGFEFFCLELFFMSNKYISIFVY